MRWRTGLLMNVGMLAMVAAMLVSCVSEPVGKLPPRWKDRKAKVKEFKPVTGHELELEVISERRTFAAGSDVSIDFRLINRGEKRVVVEEWYLDQDANLNVYYQAKTGDAPSGDWTAIEAKTPANPTRFALELNPGNSVLVSCNLKFIKDLPAGKTQYFFLYGKLNLKSLPLASDPVIITVK